MGGSCRRVLRSDRAHGRARNELGVALAVEPTNPLRTDLSFGPYGRFDSTSVGGGPACVKEWKEGADNGGATAPGVTKDRIRVVFILQNEEQLKTDPVKPQNRASGTTGTYEDAIHDFLMPELKFFETWGRDIEVHFFTSTGNDESAQRADLVAIKALKPFAAINTISGVDMNVLEGGLASAKIVTQGYNASYTDSAKASPYWWGSADNNATAINSAEVLGKQLVGKKAEFGGDDVKSQTRKIGLVNDGTIDRDLFVKELQKYGGKVTHQADLPGENADALQAAVPTVITGMKNAGVTTIATFSGAGTVQALQEAATKQEYFPEWFFTGASYQDIGILDHAWPAEQARHTFGISFINPWTEPDPKPPTGLSATDKLDPVNWYWGAGVGTANARIPGGVMWLLSGAQAAGPNLTAKTFKQGLFALPPVGGVGSGRNDTSMTGYAKTPKLPWDEYAGTGYDFAPYWWDPETEGPSNGIGVVGEGLGWYPNGAKRYVATTWPKKQFDWFDKSKSLQSFPSRPGGPLEYAGDCQGCPSTGGPGQAGTPDNSAVVFAAGGKGASAASS